MELWQMDVMGRVRLAPGSAVSMPGYARAFGSACPGCLTRRPAERARRVRAPSLGDEPLLMTVAVRVVPAGRAVAGRAARHRYIDIRLLVLAQGVQAGHLDRPAPDAVILADHEPMTGPVFPAGRQPGRAHPLVPAPASHVYAIDAPGCIRCTCPLRGPCADSARTRGAGPARCTRSGNAAQITRSRAAAQATSNHRTDAPIEPSHVTPRGVRLGGAGSASGLRPLHRCLARPGLPGPRGTPH